MAFDYNKIGFKNTVIDKLGVSNDSIPKVPVVPLKEKELKTFLDTTSQKNYDKLPMIFQLKDTLRPKQDRVQEFINRYNINK